MSQTKFGQKAEGFGPILDPDGGLICISDALRVDITTKPKLLCEDSKQWPDEYEECENGLKQDESGNLWTEPHPCVKCVCYEIYGVGEAISGQEHRWSANLTLPLNDTPYPMVWNLGISRSAIVETDASSATRTTMDIGDAFNGVPIACSYQCKSTNNEPIRWCAHTTYPFCQTVDPGINLGFNMETIAQRTNGATFTGYEQEWWINGVGISAPPCEVC